MRFASEEHLKRDLSNYERGYSQGYDHGTAYAFRASNAVGLYNALTKAIKYLNHTHQPEEAKYLLHQLLMEKGKVSDIGLKLKDDGHKTAS